MIQRMLGVLLFPLWAFTLSSAQDFWEQTNGPYGGEITDVATSGDSIIYAGTENGLFLSTDSGDTWTKTSLGNFPVTSIVIGWYGSLVVSISNSIFLSTDNGYSWKESDFPSYGVITLAINSQGDIFAGTYQGIYRSIDSGETWVQISEGLPVDHYGGVPSVHSLAIDTNGVVFAGTWDGFFSGGVSRSTNNGDTWSEILSVPVWVGAITVDSNGTIYAGTYGVYRSTDGGDNWINVGLNELDVKSLAVHPEGYLFAGVGFGNGIFCSDDNGETWSQTALNDVSVYSIAISSTGNIFTGTRHGIFRSSDGGANWVEANVGITSIEVWSLISDMEGHVFAGTRFQGVFRSEDSGQNWVKSGLQGHVVSSFAVNSKNELFAGTWRGGVYRSADRGSTWVQVNRGLYDNFEVSSLTKNSIDHIFAGGSHGVARSTKNGNLWSYVFTTGSVAAITTNRNDGLFAGLWCCVGVYHSGDNGDTWERIGPWQFTYVRSIATNSSGHLFVGTFDSGIWRSKDDGDNWINVGLADISDIWTISIGPEDQILAGTSSGVWLSTDNGETWSGTNSGLITVQVRALAFDSARYVLAGTPDGVFRSGEPLMSARGANFAIPSVWNLRQPYPNPFNPATTIEFSIPQAGAVTLTVYDLLGSEVETILRRHMDIGHHKVQWNASDVTSGIYFIRMQTGNFSQVRKVMVLK